VLVNSRCKQPVLISPGIGPVCSSVGSERAAGARRGGIVLQCVKPIIARSDPHACRDGDARDPQVSPRVWTCRGDHARDVAADRETLRHFPPWEHEVSPLAGVGELIGEDDVHPMAAGNCCYTALNELHQLRNTASIPLWFLCMIPTMPMAAPADAPVREAGTAVFALETSGDIHDVRAAAR